MATKRLEETPLEKAKAFLDSPLRHYSEPECRELVAELVAEIESLQAFKRGVDEALNMGDGSYRP